jgi:hypothetical protein
MRRQTMAMAVAMAALAVGVVTAAESKSISATGTVKAIDTVAQTLVVKTSAGDQTFKVPATSHVSYKDTGKQIQLGDLKVGEHVRVHYTKSGADMSISKIEVLPAKEAGHPAEPAKAK